jgi:molybdopterin/thiamine biosynthesis adenylyltransferase
MSRVLIVGMGGLGCPAALGLAATPGLTLGLLDDDRVELSNLHRQILFDETDVGTPKVVAAARGLSRFGLSATLELHEQRLLPETALSLMRDYDVIVEGSDNFATKFLAADAARLASRPVVHGAALQWHGTALLSAGTGGACYRCVFEDLPQGDAPSCDTAGIVGPVAGIVGAYMAQFALRILGGQALAGSFVSVDGRRGQVRERVFGRRDGCTLCHAGVPAALDRARYTQGCA